eukprot:TRINITY_DN36647_c0_g1_i1.p1 TRINITY_DN36647_c0_g1~~TRINITY_DN36647_c0_g1_i1.p1  ORF type:complete len:368 (+),score=59.38 TRINITY_DN36647_c0_g1_i1:37-1140(+)
MSGLTQRVLAEFCICCRAIAVDMGCGPSAEGVVTKSGVISQETYDQLLAEFMALDLNHDKRLSRTEFENITKHERLNLEATEVTRLFDVVDLNHDQTISFDEFLQYMSKQLLWIVAGISKEAYDNILARFVTLDANGDQMLSRSEFEDAKRLPEFLNMQAFDITHLFDTVDTDHSGNISLKEFVMYMSKRKDSAPLPVQITPQKNNLQKNMQRLGFELSVTDGGQKGVPGDGNCQFYSLSWELHGTIKKQAEIRTTVVGHMRGEGRADFEVFYAPSYPKQPATFDGFLDSMAIDKTWGDQLTLQAAANLYRLRVIVLTADQFDASARPVLILTPSQGSATKTVWISFAAQHYSPIQPTSRTPKDLLE